MFERSRKVEAFIIRARDIQKIRENVVLAWKHIWTLQTHTGAVHHHSQHLTCEHILAHSETQMFLQSYTDFASGAHTAFAQGCASLKLLTDANIHPSLSLSLPPPPPRLCFCCSANMLRFLLINCRSAATSGWFLHVWKQLAGVSAAVRPDDGGSFRLCACQVQHHLYQWKLALVFRHGAPCLLMYRDLRNVWI